MEGKARGKNNKGPKHSGKSVVEGNKEQQMEEFCTLLKNVRNMKEQRRRSDGGNGRREMSKVETATPAFEWEDFQAARGIEQRSVTGQGTLDGVRREGGSEKNEQEETSPELKLSL